jgi:hypothetical protein
MTSENMDADAVKLETRIPENRKVAGLHYGAHISQTMYGWCGYYVRLADGGTWGIARLTPASDELPGDGSDEDIIEAITAELS